LKLEERFAESGQVLLDDRRRQAQQDEPAHPRGQFGGDDGNVAEGIVLALAGDAFQPPRPNEDHAPLVGKGCRSTRGERRSVAVLPPSTRKPPQQEPYTPMADRLPRPTIGARSAGGKS